MLRSLGRSLSMCSWILGAAVGVADAQREGRVDGDRKSELLEHTVDSSGHAMALWEKRSPRSTSSILLLHGRTWSARPDFDLQVPGEQRSLMDALVREELAVYALDLRGYGATPRDDTGWTSPDEAARDLAAALRWVNENDGFEARPALLGWSLGALVSQLCAQRHPGLVSELILFGCIGDPDQTIPRAEDPPEPVRVRNTPEAAASDFITEGVITRKAIDAYVAAALAADPIRVDWRRMHQFNALSPEEVKVPTLLIDGELDPFSNSEANARLFQRIGCPDRQWVVIPGGDHAALIEDTQPRFVAAVMGFLRRER